MRHSRLNIAGRLALNGKRPLSRRCVENTGGDAQYLFSEDLPGYTKAHRGVQGFQG